MSAPIDVSPSLSPGLAGFAESRPQLQSRRVSLRLGPLGISYATDQVLWSAAASGPAGTVGAAGASTVRAVTDPAGDRATADCEDTTPSSQSVQDAATRTFGQELLGALRRQATEQGDAWQGYGPPAAQAGAGGGAAVQPAQEAQAGTEGQEQPEPQTQPDRQAGPGARMRRAISAYLACAQTFGQARSMLSAVA